jgi:hypothetical protein
MLLAHSEGVQLDIADADVHEVAAKRRHLCVGAISTRSTIKKLLQQMENNPKNQLTSK